MRRPGEATLWTAAFTGSLAVHAVLAAALVLTPRPQRGLQRETVITIHSTPQIEVERTEIAVPPAMVVVPDSVSVAAPGTEAFAGLAADEAEAVGSADTAILTETTAGGEAMITPVEEAGVNATLAGDAVPMAPASNVEQLLASLDVAPAATAGAAEPVAASIAAVDIPAEAATVAAIQDALAASVADHTPLLALAEPVAAASTAPVAGVAVTPTDVAAAPPQSLSNIQPAAAAPATAAASAVATQAAAPVTRASVPTPVVANPATLPDRVPDAARASALPLPAAATFATPVIGEAVSAAVAPVPVEVLPAPAPAPAMPVVPPRVAGLIRPDAPPVLTPHKSPQEIRSAVASLSAGERASSDDGCFLAQPIVDGEDIEIDFFAASSERIGRFHSLLEQAVEYPLALRKNIVSPAQCAALAFAGGLASDEPPSMSIELVSAAIASGGELMGLVENIGRRWFYLLVVDGEGKVHEIDGSWMSAVGPGAVVFHTPMTLTGQAGATVQLLLAVASDEILEMVWLKEGYEAGRYFDQLRAEIGANGGHADFGIAPFVIR